MAETENHDVPTTWTKYATADSDNYPVSVSAPSRVEYTFTENDTKPSESSEGHLFATGRSNGWVLQSGTRMWIRQASGDRTKLVITAG